ncbi:hypothetical protein GOBAR_AA36648 [Gossypium barbadense]|uniref:Endonuclease/exonuclease/phosphatase domain-containing protein n=1 Tax=Gossypium barbadense TaxID=3634 RepID=A0A2P5VZ14_GOSBA|nr:hypothetical protein GOBAR_AA36648 [Gossypium barbadense]
MYMNAQGTSPSNIEPNPKEHVKAITLRNGKVLVEPEKKLQQESNRENNERVQVEVTELAVNLEGQSGGLALMWRDGINVSILSFSKHHIDSMVKLENNKNIRVTRFYGHANPNLRSSSWDILRRVGDSVREDGCVGGEFNAILNDVEKEGDHKGVRTYMNDFKEVMDDLALVDVKPDSRWFTWVNNRIGGV